MLKGLARRGHQVDVVSAFPLKKPYPNYTQICEFSVEGVPKLVNNFTYTGMKGMVSNEFPAFAVANIAGNILCKGLDLPEMQKLIKNPPNDPPYDLVLTQVNFKFCCTNVSSVIMIG